MSTGGTVAASLAVKYDGGAVASGEMDVRELAPALLSFADAVASANRVLNPESAESPRVSVVGSPERGSFLISLSVQEPTLVERAVGLFNGDGVSATTNALAIVTAVGGAIGLIAKKVRRGERTGREREDGFVEMRLADGQTLFVHPNALRVADDDEFRRAAQAAVRPVDGAAADVLSVSTDGEELALVTPSETDEFFLPTNEVPVSESELDMVLSPVTAVFRAGRKWQFNDGTQSSYFTMADLAFEERVIDGRVALGANDRLSCRVRITQTDSGGVLRTTKTILRVIEHRQGHHEPTLD